LATPYTSAKKVEASSSHPDREQQFDYIAVQRAAFTAAGLPILSVDTKKKELVGNFRNAGQTWSLEPTAVNVHDYPHDAIGRAVPYGVYDLTTNRGFILLGTSGDTPPFADDAAATWWQTKGQVRYAGTDQLLLLADAGGSNGCQIRAWKERLQVQVVRSVWTDGNRVSLSDRVFEVEPDRAPLVQSNQPQLGWGTAAELGDAAGLHPRHYYRYWLGGAGRLQPGEYPTGQKVSNAEMDALAIEPHAICPRWNYTIRPRSPVRASL
jgi:hypothetical protein